MKGELPTGYEKSLIYEFLPIACQEELSVDAFIIVIKPLNAIIEQQKKKLGNTLCICLQDSLTGLDMVPSQHRELLKMIFMVEMEPNSQKICEL